MSSNLLTTRLTATELEQSNRQQLLAEIDKAWRAMEFWKLQAQHAFEVNDQYFKASGVGDGTQTCAQYSLQHGLNEANTMAIDRIKLAVERMKGSSC